MYEKYETDEINFWIWNKNEKYKAKIGINIKTNNLKKGINWEIKFSVKIII